MQETRNMSSQRTESINILAHDMQSLVKKIQELRHLGIEDSNIALPKICVVGDQSTGKSSLIEGISDIKLPRSAGTCTRCPMEINLSESGPGTSWTCRVFLTRKYMYDSAKKVARTQKRALGPWAELDSEDELFITLTDKADVPDAIKWAQLAILNPTRATSDYIPGQNEGTDPTFQYVKFSPNIVRLDISAPDFPNLSFYDLPGVISLTEFDEESYLVLLVENLVKEYISHENCIVLLTQTMTDDATNSRAAKIIRDVRGAKSRTLGVLTKPDRIQSGESYAQWREILHGDKFSLGHGYYVVKNDPDPLVEHSQAREEETKFFSSHPWSTELFNYRERFGTRRLQEALSTLLLEQILGCLPKIINQIDEKASAIDAELLTLPNPPSENVQYILSSTLSQFKDDIRSHIDGGSSKYPLQKLWSHIAKDFRLSLTLTRPSVEILSVSDKFEFKEDPGTDSDCQVTSVQSTVKRKAPGAPVAPVRIKHEPGTLGYDTNHFDDFSGPAKKFTWNEIREINEDSYRVGLPQQTDPRAIEHMSQLSVKHWHGPMGAFLVATHKLVQDMLMKQLENTFHQYHQTGLYEELKKIIRDYLIRLREDHFQQAMETFNIEWNKPFTMASTALEHAKIEAYRQLKGARHVARAKIYLDRECRFPAGDPRREAEMKKLGEAELGPDQFAQEMKMMAVRNCPLLPSFRRYANFGRRMPVVTMRWQAPALWIRSARESTPNCFRNVAMK